MFVAYLPSDFTVQLILYQGIISIFERIIHKSTKLGNQGIFFSCSLLVLVHLYTNFDSFNYKSEQLCTAFLLKWIINIAICYYVYIIIIVCGCLIAYPVDVLFPLIIIKYNCVVWAKLNKNYKKINLTYINDIQKCYWATR